MHALPPSYSPSPYSISCLWEVKSYLLNSKVVFSYGVDPIISKIKSTVSIMNGLNLELHTLLK
jgi:hypothetical protein